MTRLTLVAHALTPALRGLVLGGDSDPDEASLKEARELAAGGEYRLDRADLVLAGPERAAIWTAEALGLAPVLDPALRDRHYGSWTGRVLERLLVEEAGPVTAWLDAPHSAPPGGESANAVVGRAGAWLASLSSDGRRTVVAVAHPTIVRALVLHVLGAPPAALRRIDVRPLSIVRLTEHGNQWSLVVGR
jgi:broad specificity phosphatase PhoE